MASATRFSKAKRRAMEMEKRVSDMIMELGQRQAKTDARLEEMMQGNCCYQFAKSEKQEEEGAGGQEYGDGANKVVVKNDWGKSTRCKFPKVDGEGFEGWVMRSKYFFNVAEVAESEKVRIVALHLKGKALLWHRGFVSLQGEKTYGDWGYYIKSLSARFGANTYEDPLTNTNFACF